MISALNANGTPGKITERWGRMYVHVDSPAAIPVAIAKFAQGYEIKYGEMAATAGCVMRRSTEMP